jgi:metal-sulfur cluster biosynthetic enzyme
VTLLHDTVMRLLDTVQDPCSARMGAPLGLVEMGLVESVVIEDTVIRIRMILTGPGCFFYFQFADQITRTLEPVAEGRGVDVVIDDAILWTRDRMSPKGRPKRELPRSDSAEGRPLGPKGRPEANEPPACHAAGSPVGAIPVRSVGA